MQLLVERPWICVDSHLLVKTEVRRTVLLHTYGSSFVQGDDLYWIEETFKGFGVFPACTAP